MKTFRELNIGDSVYFFQHDCILNKIVIVDIAKDSIGPRFYYDTPFGKFYVGIMFGDLDSTYSCGLYSCIEAILDMINNDDDKIKIDCNEFF